MALVNCPECGEQNVSDSASQCPKCGYNIKQHYMKKTVNKEVSNIQNWFEKYKVAIVIAIIALVVLFGTIYSISAKQKEEQELNEKIEQQYRELRRGGGDIKILFTDVTLAMNREEMIALEGQPNRPDDETILTYDREFKGANGSLFIENIYPRAVIWWASDDLTKGELEDFYEELENSPMSWGMREVNGKDNERTGFIDYKWRENNYNIAIRTSMAGKDHDAYKVIISYEFAKY